MAQPPPRTMNNSGGYSSSPPPRCPSPRQNGINLPADTTLELVSSGPDSPRQQQPQLRHPTHPGYSPVREVIHEVEQRHQRPQQFRVLHTDHVVRQHPLPARDGDGSSSVSSSGGSDNGQQQQQANEDRYRAINEEYVNNLFPDQDGDMDDEIEHINIRDDIGLSDQQLINIPTKDLNKRIKSRGLSKARAKIIKQERRTLKNRGYAANCRVKREDEESQLEDEIKSLDEKNLNLSNDLELLYDGFLDRDDFTPEDQEKLRRLERINPQPVYVHRNEV